MSQDWRTEEGPRAGVPFCPLPPSHLFTSNKPHPPFASIQYPPSHWVPVLLHGHSSSSSRIDIPKP
ncbi:hypothetical protein N657DRAFT_228646 [Parathielavia appendiculata]|uniref:Uncharacterized protein n=1 Tax=Parathielavia appendiculata TaxID=2587402 RepID=A0AAN6Z6S3_9PEZI|nr:hypothetical protein N657DRAFT_228646 [Parathielavia appendiculata]